jgi:uncharacterized membrane protein (DUF2068 family)
VPPDTAIPETGQTRKTLRAIALFEAIKGLLALAAASGVLALMHADLHSLALRLVEHAHLNPAAHVPMIFIAAATHLQDMRLMSLALGAAAYSTIRLAEAWGLYHGRVWAEVLAAVSGAIYVPFEINGVLRHASGLSVGLLVVNLAIVWVMVRALWLRRRAADLSSTPAR